MGIEVKIEGTKEISKALVEIFSPVTELLGTLGDRVRVYRQISLMRALKRAQEIAHNEKLTMTEPPVKFLVPFIEDCSLETPEDEKLIDMWAKLLVSASTEFKPEHNLFIRILRELSSAEAKLLEFIIAPETHSHYSHGWHLEDVEHSWTDPFIYITIRNAIDGIGKKLNDDFPFDLLEAKVRELDEGPGSIIYFFDVSKGRKNEYPLDGVHTSPRGPIDDDFNPVSIAMLKSLGLIGDFKSSELWFGSYVFEVYAYYLTNLGAHFVASCTTNPTHGSRR